MQLALIFVLHNATGAVVLFILKGTLSTSVHYGQVLSKPLLSTKINRQVAKLF